LSLEHQQAICTLVRMLSDAPPAVADKAVERLSP
jgi:hypothetical protein